MIRTVRPESAQYHIEEFLGEGSMARVFKAIRVDSRGFSRQTVALKIIKSEKQVRSLVHEMETLSRVRSAHCVSFLGWENLPEGPAIVMEWIDGISLEALAKSANIEWPLIEEILAQIQLGLLDLKAAGLCHGDLSPSNVLVDVHGKVRLVDFGLSIPLEPSAIAGTAQFMAPERWEGATPSFECDLFSLGLLAMDLANANLRSIETAVQLRERADRCATESAGWLARDPKLRENQALKSELRRQKQLGKLVESAISRRSFLARTLNFGAGRKSQWIRLALPAIFLFVILFPIAPFGQSDRYRLVPSARLEIRTHKWIHVQLGLIDLGYSPIAHTGLPAGLHRLRWKSATSQGSKVISIGYGESKLLTDRDF